MDDRETPRMHKYGESKTTRIMTVNVRHVDAWAGLTKYQTASFLFDRVYMVECEAVYLNIAGLKQKIYYHMTLKCETVRVKSLNSSNTKSGRR